MQLNLISLSLTATVLITIVSALDTTGAGGVLGLLNPILGDSHETTLGDGSITGSGGLTNNIRPSLIAADPTTAKLGDYFGYGSQKPAFSFSKRVATAIRRRRALTRPGKQANEEDKNEDENISPPKKTLLK